MYRPMLAEAWPEPFDDEAFLFEVKWDGYRAIAQTDSGVRFFGRRRELTDLFPELGLPASLGPCVLDGEIVALDKAGRPSFYGLRKKGRRLVYMAFDLLEKAGVPLLARPLRERRASLEDLLLHLEDERILLSRGQTGEGRLFFEGIRSLSLEGMMAKDLSSPYLPGERSRSWRKVLNGHEATVSVPVLLRTPSHEWVAVVEEHGHPRGRLRIPKAEVPDRLFSGIRVERMGDVWRLTPPPLAEVRYRELTPDGQFRHGMFRRFLTP